MLQKMKSFFEKHPPVSLGEILLKCDVQRVLDKVVQFPLLNKAEKYVLDKVMFPAKVEVKPAEPVVQPVVKETVEVI